MWMSLHQLFSYPNTDTTTSGAMFVESEFKSLWNEALRGMFAQTANADNTTTITAWVYVKEGQKQNVHGQVW